MSCGSNHCYFQYEEPTDICNECDVFYSNSITCNCPGSKPILLPGESQNGRCCYLCRICCSREGKHAYNDFIERKLKFKPISTFTTKDDALFKNHNIAPTMPHTLYKKITTYDKLHEVYSREYRLEFEKDKKSKKALKKIMLGASDTYINKIYYGQKIDKNDMEKVVIKRLSEYEFNGEPLILTKNERDSYNVVVNWQTRFYGISYHDKVGDAEKQIQTIMKERKARIQEQEFIQARLDARYKDTGSTPNTGGFNFISNSKSNWRKDDSETSEDSNEDSGESSKKYKAPARLSTNSTQSHYTALSNSNSSLDFAVLRQ